jgi:hypothetical protein
MANTQPLFIIPNAFHITVPAAKARGVVLGGPKLAQARKRAIASIKSLADQHAANVLPVIREIQRAGATSLHQVATL